MGDGNEFDIYEDLDVFESDEKQQEKNADYLELREKLTEAQEIIRQLQGENVSLKEQIVNHQKAEGTLERNTSSLLITAKAELKRREQEIHELRKEKDNILFRRKDKLRKNVHSFGTQTQITCKPFMVYELKRTDDAPKERLFERRDENQSSNPFAKSKENNIENKSNHKPREFVAEKNGNHRHHDEYDLRVKLANPRSRDDERREPSNAERSKRRRSRSTSKDRKRARRSRSREQQQRSRRDRNHYEQNSPERISRNQRGKNDIKESQSPKRSTRCQSPKRSMVKSEPVEKHHNKRKHDEDISKRRSKSKSESEQLLTEKEIKREKEKENEKEKKKEKEKEKAIVNQCVAPSDYLKDDTKQENNIDERPTNLNWIDANGDHGLEEGELDEDDDGRADADALNRPNEKMNRNMAKSQLLPTSPNVVCKNEDADDAKLKIDTNAPMELQQNHDLPEKNDDINKNGSLSARDEPTIVDESTVEDELKGKHELELKPTLEIEEHTNPIDKIESESKSVQSLDGIVEKSQRQNFEAEDKISAGNDVAVEGIETLSNVPSERDQLLGKSDRMEIDPPAETEKTNENVNAIMEAPQTEDQKQEIDTEKNAEKSDESSATVVDVAEVPSLSETTPYLNNSISLTADHDENKQTATAAVANGSPEAIFNGVLNTSGSKSVKNISTSTKDYLIVENENNETTIYITRKKKQKKKKKKILENV